jgi:ABC-2 type transport system permease protein
MVSDIPELSEIFDEETAVASIFMGGFTDMTSPEGYLNSQLFAMAIPLLLIIFSINCYSGTIATEEDRGTLDVLLSHPISRLRVISEKLIAILLESVFLSIVIWLSVVIGAAMVKMDLSIAGPLSVTVSALLLSTTFGALALAATAMNGKRGIAIGISGGVGFLTYFVYALAPLSETLKHGSKISPWHYYITADPLSNGLNLVHAGILISITILFCAIALFMFNKRDISV